MIDLFKMNSQLSELLDDDACVVNNRGACELGTRGRFLVFVYPILGVIFLSKAHEHHVHLLEWIIGLLAVISIFRFFSGNRLAKSSIMTTEKRLKSYGWWTLTNTLCVGTFVAFLSFDKGMSDEFMIMMVVVVGITGAAVGTMTLYFHFWTLYTSTIFVPIAIACLYHGMTGDGQGYLLALISSLYPVFIILIGRCVENEYWRGEVAQIKLEKEASDLKLAIELVEEKETELRKHRDHLQELVDDQLHDMRLSKEAAERASDSKSEFLANMSHELRTPIHAILSFSKLGKNKTKNTSEEIFERFFTQINNSGQRLLSFVDNLLDLSKMEAMKMEYHFEKADLATIIEQSIAEQETRLQELKLTVEVTPAQLETTAEIDPVRIGQVITNLFSNAIKFSLEGKTITFSVEQDKICPGRRKGDDVFVVPALLFRIRDQGVGIPETELNAVFDKFVQSSKTKTEAGGTGLGLSICKEIIEAHQGELWVESSSGDGACFSFLIPITRVVFKKKKENTRLKESQPEEAF